MQGYHICFCQLCMILNIPICSETGRRPDLLPEVESDHHHHHIISGTTCHHFNVFPPSSRGTSSPCCCLSLLYQLCSVKSTHSIILSLTHKKLHKSPRVHLINLHNAALITQAEPTQALCTERDAPANPPASQKQSHKHIQGERLNEICRA